MTGITSAAQWADAIEAEQNGIDLNAMSLWYSSGEAAGVPIICEVTDYAYEFVSLDGRWVAKWDSSSSGHWYGYDVAGAAETNQPPS